MGIGDPFHKHPLRFQNTPVSIEWYDNKREEVITKCFHCELPIEGSGYSCSRCDFWVHLSCATLPPVVTHPLHDKHPLILLSDTKDTKLCNSCQTPCGVENYIYCCRACEFSLHLKCFFTCHHEKHDHVLPFSMNGHYKNDYFDCRICGYPVYDSNFGCVECEFFVHHDCTLIPSTIKHHHVHELTIRHGFPKECDHDYCDICEDRDEKDLDRTLSYYYCIKCDYIAHVRCITEQKEDFLLIERTTHEHPLRLVRDPMIREDYGFKLGCNQCKVVFDDSMLLFPSLIKHPLHPNHAITWVCENGVYLFKCTDCEFTLHYNDAIKFTHPLCGDDNVEFRADIVLFRCDACGELGKGSRMCYDVFDLHLECFALPGNIIHENHPDHPLYLFSHDDTYTYRKCSICNEEIDPENWVYCCRECDSFLGHLNCVASGLLSNIRSSINNGPHFCAIIEPNNASFEFQMANKSLEDTSIPSPRHSSSSGYLIYVKDTQESKIDDDDNANCFSDLGIKEAGNALCCPKCNILIRTPTKHSSIQDWETTHFNEIEKLNNDQTLLKLEPLTLLSDGQIDDLYCSICSVVIFPPTYSCSTCQIYFHRSCTDLPRKVSLSGLTYVLVEPPFHGSLSSCSQCNYPITGYAYLSSDGGSIFDVQCILVAPLVNQVNDRNHILCRRNTQHETNCTACGTCIHDGVPFLKCSYPRSSFSLHIECALLPPIIRHRIHKHPLELAQNLAELDDEYICDACEKELNPNLWAYRCMDTCKGYATSHVSCLISSKKKCHFK